MDGASNTPRRFYRRKNFGSRGINKLRLRPPMQFTNAQPAGFTIPGQSGRTWGYNLRKPIRSTAAPVPPNTNVEIRTWTLNAVTDTGRFNGSSNLLGWVGVVTWCCYFVLFGFITHSGIIAVCYIADQAETVTSFCISGSVFKTNKTDLESGRHNWVLIKLRDGNNLDDTLKRLQTPTDLMMEVSTTTTTTTTTSTTAFKKQKLDDAMALVTADQPSESLYYPQEDVICFGL